MECVASREDKGLSFLGIVTGTMYLRVKQFFSHIGNCTPGLAVLCKFTKYSSKYKITCNTSNFVK